MPSTLPVIRIRTSEDTVLKIKAIAKEHKRSLSNELERLIEDYIAQYEKENGPIKTENTNNSDILEDIRDKFVFGLGKYKDELKDEVVQEMYDRFEDYQDEISIDEFRPLLQRCIVKRRGTTYIEHNVLKEKVQTLYYRKKKLE